MHTFCPRATLTGPSAAAILKRGSHLLVLQYKCKYGHLRTAGLWIMEAGCAWYSWEGDILPLKNRARKFTTWWCTSLFLCLFAHWAVRQRPEVRQRHYRCRWLNSLVSFIPFFLQGTHLKCCWNGLYHHFCDSEYADDVLPLLENIERERELQGFRQCGWGVGGSLCNDTADYMWKIKQPPQQTAGKLRRRTSMFSSYSCVFKAFKN